ncbi:ATP-binding cassette domain-containing protein [Hahella sp. SMD15-11]|uniref:ATP-binding cassette domain-containing protein n=1 Tax=Thermohahella caldifontis TaxID=3142973 RepID=A0AB39UTH6_9GAMM
MKLTARHLSVRRGNRQCLDGVDVALRQGELVAVLGANGAGKSTLLQVLGGALVPESGAVYLGDRPVTELDRLARARQLAWLPQQAQVHWPVRVRELVALGRYPHGEPEAVALSHPAVEAALALTDARHLADRDAMSLSGGETVRVLLARALAVDAPFLLADEPLAGLDPAHQLDVLKRLRRWCAAAHGAIVVMHDVALAMRFADRVWVLHDGRLLADGAPREVLTDAVLEQALAIRVLRGEAQGQPWVLPWDEVTGP